ncbi:MAG: tetratricopeptide repeat protein [Acidobacteriota bacterium]
MEQVGHTSRRRGYCGRLAATCLLLAALPVLADKAWWEYYEEGLAAIAANDLAIAEQKLKAAADLHPEPGRKVKKYGMQYVDMYVPDYQLGRLYYIQGRYEDAIARFEKARASGVIQKGDREYKALDEMSRLASTKLESTAIAQPVEDIPALVREAQSLLSQGRIDQAKEILERIRKVNPNDRAATELAGQIARKEDEIRAEQAKALAAAGEKNKQGAFQSAMEQADQALRTKDYAAARQSAQVALGTGVDDARAQDTLKKISLAQGLDALRAAVAGGDWSGAERLARQVAAIDPQNGDLRSLQGAVEKGLSGMSATQLQEEGLTAFYSGNYRQAIALLEKVTGSSADPAKGHFYLGCSYAALGFGQRGERPALLQKARDAFTRARQLDASLRHDVLYISPRILKVFAETR